MRRFVLKSSIIWMIIFSIVLLIYVLNNRKYSFNKSYRMPSVENQIFDRIVISFVACESRFEESINLMKSVLMFSKTPVHFVIFSDDTLKVDFQEILKSWESIIRDQLKYEIHNIQFPENHIQEWMNLFSRCAAQRLFIPKLLPGIDSMIYVDTDTLFLGPVDELWSLFSKFNSSQMTAMALEDESTHVSWYPRFAKHPFYGKHGLNSGVMLMNLTRMRRFGWVDYVTPVMLKWKLHIPWGDQDIINIVAHYHPEVVYVLSCHQNYRTDQCVYGEACAAAAERGVLLLHASRRAFHTRKYPAFQVIYQAMNDYKIGSNPRNYFLSNIERYFNVTDLLYCNNKNTLLKGAIETLERLHPKPDS